MIGFGLLLTIGEPGMQWSDRLVFTIWPLPVAAFFILTIGATIVGSYKEIKKYIKNRRS
jgi:hypothetical protein